MSPKGGATTAPSGGDFSCINQGGREELVGKRFLLVSSSGGKSPKSPPKLSRISEWNWKAGIIRCAIHVDSRDSDLQVRTSKKKQKNFFPVVRRKRIKCLEKLGK